ncbi:MAG: 3-((3aS,4S,7aS)-7a-methyl-1,5-dioxo-octahydro-1H-inden-4-yl)propanoate--CoA ligase FadD3 [Mycobacterium sp.]|nr:3-((3aS,4S,7aS)-7a-methyl-1,5-dioxo-octahydro-1H-inden-4-yl)propanoate--CoA ligase FadD3 [Mycobacterium sp.]
MALDHADDAAVLTDERRLTFAELRQEVRHAAAALAGLGVHPGDRVAIWSPNTWHWVVACLAIHYAGAVVVPINTRYTAEEAADILVRTHAPVLIAMGRFLGVDRVADLDRVSLPALRHVVRVPIEKSATEGPEDSWGAFLAGPQLPLSEVDARAAAVRPDDVSDILFTSGTTGRSKGVVCAHRQSLSASAAWADCGRITSADRYLCINPFFHNFGYKAGILACLQTGATLIPQLTFEPDLAMRTVQDMRVTVLPGPPTIYSSLLDHPGRAGYDLSSLRFAVTGAAVVPVVLIERMQSDLDFDIVLTAYGLTEASGFGTMCRPDDDPVTVATTCGRPIAGFEARIDTPDDTGAGEVLLRGPNVMLGYLDDPQATAAAIDADGWLHTGDIGTIDTAGNLRITDRLKDMYICGGFNVYPAEVEQVLARLDGVADVAVIGMPDDRLGEVGRAFVVRRPGAVLDEDTVIAHTCRHLANFKTPRSVVFLDELPRNAGGKVVKPTLREMI